MNVLVKTSRGSEDPIAHNNPGKVFRPAGGVVISLSERGVQSRGDQSFRRAFSPSGDRPFRQTFSPAEEEHSAEG